ncbi:transglutaminase-like cysteine peptidase [soil metagenome]
MSFRAYSTLALTLAILGTIAGPAIAIERQAPIMEVTGATSQPIGHYEFCRTHGDECSVRTSRDVRVKLTPGLWNQLVAVNGAVNAAVVPATDEEIYGRAEVWAYPGKYGDCEDLVLEKRRDLIVKGWPVGALLITVVRQKNGDGHAVLTVLSDRGDLVLDNLESRVLVWTDTDYRYVKRQSEYDSGRWEAIDDARTTAVGSLTR